MYGDYVEMLDGVSAVLRDPDAACGVLKELYSHSHLAYREIADRSGVSKSHVFDVINGNKVPSVVTWSCIVNVLTEDILEERQ